jgi:hypothetical protein
MCELRGFSNTNRQQAGRHWIESAGMAGLAAGEKTLDSRDSRL